jgi:putative cardiolipin synthase
MTCTPPAPIRCCSGLSAYPNVEVRLFNPFPMGRDSLSARLTLSLFDLGRVNHRMHNKLLVADGAMAVAGGRNIGNEYFMVSGLANYIDLDAFAVGPIVAKLAALFDQYWNSDTVFPVRSIAVPEGTDAELRARFEASTDPARGAPPAPAPKYAKDIIEQRNVEEELAEGRLDLHWAEAEAFADSPEKVLGQARRAPTDRREPKTVRQGLMRELLLSRREVLVSSPYLVPNPEVIEDIREGRSVGRADHGDHQFARVHRRAAGACRLPALPPRHARPRRAAVRGGAEPGEPFEGPGHVRPVDRALSCQGGGDRR